MAQSPSGSWLVAALPYLAAVTTGVAGFFGARFTALAQLQRTLLDASRQWVEETQAQRARDGVRISELEAEILRQRKVIDTKIAENDALARLMERKGIKVPGRPSSEI